MHNVAIIGASHKIPSVYQSLCADRSYHVQMLMTEAWQGGKAKTEAIKIEDRIRLGHIRHVKKLTTKDIKSRHFRNIDSILLIPGSYQQMSDTVMELLKLGFSKNQTYLAP